MKKATLTIVDLAGSERLSKSQPEAIRAEGTKNINKSIAALGNCIAALAKESRINKFVFANSHIPFRDSKLTRLLTDCLGYSIPLSILQ